MQDDRHMRTSDELQNLVREVRDGTFKYQGKPRRSTDWAQYDEAQTREVSDTLLLIRKFVDLAAREVPEEKHEGPGRPPYPPDDVAKALLLQAYFGVSNRVASGLAELFSEKLGISSRFSYKTIERGYDPSPVSRILQKVFELTARLGNAGEETFSVDGTGDPSSTKENYESVRASHRKTDDLPDWTAMPSRHKFQLAALLVGVHTKMIAGFGSASGFTTGELGLFPAVLHQTFLNCPGMKMVLGDALYGTRSACALVSRYNAAPFFMPRKNATLAPNGVPSWKRMVFDFIDDTQSWLETYHMRSISESANSVDKRRFPWKLRKRLAWRRMTESFLRREVYNIRQYHNLSFLHPSLIEKLPR